MPDLKGKPPRRTQREEPSDAVSFAAKTGLTELAAQSILVRFGPRRSPRNEPIARRKQH